MQIGLSGLTGKQAPALRCFQCKGTLNLQGFHTLQLVSSPFYFPHPCTPSPGRRRLGSPGVPLRRSSSLPPGMVLGWCTATRQRGQAQAGQQQCEGCLSPAPQAWPHRPGAARPAPSSPRLQCRQTLPRLHGGRDSDLLLVARTRSRFDEYLEGILQTL